MVDEIVEFKVIEISELDKGCLCNIFTTDKNRNIKQKQMFAYDDSEKIEMLELIADELNIECKIEQINLVGE